MQIFFIFFTFDINSVIHFTYQLEQGHLSQAILPEHMVFSIKDPPRLGHVVKLTNDSDSTASPVLDYIDSFTQEDINRGIILYVSASVQVPVRPRGVGLLIATLLLFLHTIQFHFWSPRAVMPSRWTSVMVSPQ